VLKSPWTKTDTARELSKRRTKTTKNRNEMRGDPLSQCPLPKKFRSLRSLSIWARRYPGNMCLKITTWRYPCKTTSTPKAAKARAWRYPCKMTSSRGERGLPPQTPPTAGRGGNPITMSSPSQRNTNTKATLSPCPLLNLIDTVSIQCKAKTLEGGLKCKH
jgi:hypothetical protein